jgi:hypothetical protein
MECEHCAKRLGDAAVLSFEAGVAIEALPVPSAPVRWKMPVLAVAAALAIAALGGLPVLFKDVPSVFEGIKWLFSDGLPLLVDEISRLFGAKASQTIAILSITSTVLFLMIGVIVARSRMRSVPGAAR